MNKDFHRGVVPCLVDHETREEVMDYFVSKAPDQFLAVELGVFMGGTTFRLADGLKKAGVNGEIYAVDSWEYPNISSASFAWAEVESAEEGEAKFLEWVEKWKYKCEDHDPDVPTDKVCIIPHKADTAEASKEYADGTLDYLFMDASHGYGGLLKEIIMWLPKMKEKCIIAVHDYPTPGIRQAVKEGFGEIDRTTSNGATAILKDTL